MKIKSNQLGFGTLEILLSLLVIGLIGLGGFLVYSRQQDEKNSQKLEQKISQLENENNNQQAEQQPVEEINDNEAILAAAGCKTAMNEGDECKIKEQKNNLALVTVGGDQGGINVILAKENGKWEIIYQYNGDISDEILQKYDIPEAWLGPSL